MKLVKYSLKSNPAHSDAGILRDNAVIPLNLPLGEFTCLSDILDADDAYSAVTTLQESASTSHPVEEVIFRAPVDQQEVWAAGVTYIRSKSARMEESEAAASCYDRVYESPRPELFMKATPHRVSGPGEPLRIRKDSKWNVPEPELTLVLNSRGKLVGFTIGNDMSSRDIEGDNPLYLPQAKVYDQCCGLGPCITLASAMPARDDTGIRLAIHRGGDVVFEGEISASQMARTFEDLIEWLTRDNSFPAGAFLLTGTGIVPGSDFTLAAGDIVKIQIDGIGELSNPVVQG